MRKKQTKAEEKKEEKKRKQKKKQSNHETSIPKKKQEFYDFYCQKQKVSFKSTWQTKPANKACKQTLCFINLGYNRWKYVATLI